jgi:hypothetical protein
MLLLPALLLANEAETTMVVRPVSSNTQVCDVRQDKSTPTIPEVHTVYVEWMLLVCATTGQLF